MAVPVRRGFCLLAAFAVLAAGSLTAEASGGPERPTPDARAWVLVDASDGEQLAGRGDTNQLSIASATKLMTAYVALRELPLNRKIAAPDYQPISPAETLAGLAPGERMSVSDLLYALLLASANDAAVTLANGASGSVPAFVREMNRTAAALGLTGTHYENPIGLDSAGNYSTASDLATLTRRLRRERIFREIVDTEHAVLKTGDHTREITNRNTLLFEAPWVNGVKTGHTLDAGYVLVGSGTRKGATLVSAVLGAPGEAARDAGTLELLEYGFSLYREKTVASGGERIASPELKYQDSTLPLVADAGLRVPLRRGQDLDVTTSAPEEVEGPIERGHELGEMTVTVDGRDAGTVSLVAARAADEATFLEQVNGRLPVPLILIALGAGVILMGAAAARRGTRRRRRIAEATTNDEEPMSTPEQERIGQGERP
jgi:serine-type D-Ala-D-Ala carboxypeptidase (penicillin-binding protein 5/6)